MAERTLSVNACSELPQTVDGKVDDFKNFLHERVKSPPRLDTYEAPFAAAILKVMEDTKNYKQKSHNLVDTVKDVFTYRDHFSSVELFQLSLRAVQAQALDIGLNDYPEKYLANKRKTTEAKFGEVIIKWSDLLGNILEGNLTLQNNRNSQEEMHSALLLFNITSNLYERYASVPLFMHMVKGELDEKEILGDLACSQQQGGKMLLSKDKFDEVDVMKRTIDKSKFLGLEIDPALSERVNSILAERGMLKGVNGVDIMPIDEISRIWARTCRFRPPEWLDKKRVNKYDSLDRIDERTIPGLKFVESDLSQEKVEAYPDILHENSCGINTVFTVLYQQRPKEQVNFVKNAIKFSKRYVLIQDAIKVDPNNNQNLHIGKDFTGKAWQYRTLVYDKKNPDLGFQEILLWDSARCKRMQLGTGKLAVKGALRTPEELLIR